MKEVAGEYLFWFDFKMAQWRAKGKTLSAALSNANLEIQLAVCLCS
jgi:hypothetical protein